MKTRLKRARRTQRRATLVAQDLAAGAHFIFAEDSVEPRGMLGVWKDLRGTRPDRCIVVAKQGEESIHVNGDSSQTVNLTDEARLDRIFGCCESIYLDITGMDHDVWTPLLSSILRSKGRLRVVYAEPVEYRPHAAPTSPAAFDLSAGYRGLAPLPGLARLSDVSEKKALFVPFLGFEGSRASYLALQRDPVPEVVPVVGVPGFRVEYPAHTIANNHQFLTDHRAYKNIRFAKASCPFGAYEVLRELQKDYPGYYLYIAPIGTKPHSLGAVKFALDNPESTDLMYDHPVRRAGRTSGIGVVNIYEMESVSA